jgi:serine/threonine-protein kinase
VGALLPEPGTIVGSKYCLVRKIGEGGMGAVFEAENIRTKKRVAVKWLHPSISDHEQAAARLVREAQAAARVRHPNVVDVYDVEREGDSVFLVMEFLEGEPLSHALLRRDLAMHELVALLLPAMRGVAAAHKQGVVHRDIKPDNIFLAEESDDGQRVPKVLDFGVSKLDPGNADQLSLTRTGSAVGTPRYMSYEQLAGWRDVDGRADVYAFGVILYEALTGRPPFEANSYSELIVKVATQSPLSPKSLRAEIPSPLADVVLAAMEKDRAQRIPSMAHLIRALEPFSTQAGFRAQTTAENPGRAPSDRPAVDLGARTAPGTPVELVPVSAASSRESASGQTRSRRHLVAFTVGAGLVLVAGLGAWQQWGTRLAERAEVRVPPTLPSLPSAPTASPKWPAEPSAPPSPPPSTPSDDGSARPAKSPTEQPIVAGPAKVLPPKTGAHTSGRSGSSPKKTPTPVPTAVPAGNPAAPTPLAAPSARPEPPTQTQTQPDTDSHRVYQAPHAAEF